MAAIRGASAYAQAMSPDSRHPIGVVLYRTAVHAWALDLPGCIASARSLEDLRATLPLVLAEHIGWLTGHGEHVADPGGWEIAETLDGASFASTGGEFCFEADRAPMSAGELETAIARMAYARADLLAAIDGVPDAVLDWSPPASAFASFDAWAPEVRTIRDVVTHVLQLEAYYRGGLRDGASSGVFERVVGPVEEGARTVELLRSLTDDERSRVFQPVRPSRTTAEEWTVRKLVRRVISHERAHTAEIWQRRSWVLIGAPVVRA